MSDTARLVRKIVDVARAVVVNTSLIHEAVVLSKNPDGSLNVDDGSGGCVRVANYTNARIGQKIRLGLEPPPGTQSDDPPRFFDLPPFDIPPEFPPELPGDDTLLYSDETFTWGADNVNAWGSRTRYGESGESYYNRGFFGNFASTDRTGNTLAEAFRYPHAVSGIPLEFGFSRVLYRYPPLDTVITDDQVVEAAWVDVSLQGINARTPGAKVEILEWRGIGGRIGSTDIVGIDYTELPYSPSEPAKSIAFLNRFLGREFLGSKLLAGMTTTGLYPAANRIQLSSRGIAVLNRHKPTVLAFLLNFDSRGFPPPTRGTVSPLADIWQPWVGELPGRHAPKPKKGRRILASDPDPEPFRQTRLRLKLSDA